MDLSANRVSVDNIVKDLENAPSHQLLRQSKRLNPPVMQLPELELRHSKCLKYQVNLLITEDPDIEINLAIASIVSKIIDPPSVEAASHQQKVLGIIFEYIYYNVLTDIQIYISLIHTLIRLYISIP